MCGINGIIGLWEEGQAKGKILTMNQSLQHRGPDDEGFFVEKNVALGHRRLSIIDLSNAGHQPMHSHDGRYVLVFNGEIYNYISLKKQLDYPFKTGTDTEVILAAYAKWGEACLEHLNGMFAFAIYDREEKKVLIARDRLGIKPLYYHISNGVLVFSSELRALLKSALVPKKADRESLVDYLRYQTVHAPATIVEGVKMLMPGNFMRVDAGGELAVSTHCWWKADGGQYQLQNTSATVIQQEIKKRMYEAVECRLVADVPFGAFLSGGIDSSLVVGIMAEVSTQPVHTFNISFAEEQYSEARYARQIAEKYKTNHNEIQLSPADFLELLPAALQAMDHPSGDGPNTYVVSKATKEAGISMALTGLGGDELFAGYPVFKQMHRLDKLKGLWKLPVALRRLAGETLYKMKPGMASGKIRAALAEQEYSFCSNFAYTRRVLLEEQITALLSNPQEKADALVASLESGIKSEENILSSTSKAEMGSYMQNVLLRDADQMSMAHALELRVPFLDYRLVEYVLSVPDAIKYPHTQKQLLTDSLPHILPANIINRPKMGFVFPWAHWLKNELHDLAHHQLMELGRHGFFKEEAMEELWQKFKKGDPNVSYSRIWPLVVLSHWLEQNEVSL